MTGSEPPSYGTVDQGESSMNLAKNHDPVHLRHRQGPQRLRAEGVPVGVRAPR